MRSVISAVVAATVLLAGSQAVARTISVASIKGDWNDNPLYTLWRAKIEFDPSLGVISAFEDGYKLSWDSSMATPSPILDAGITLTKRYTLSNFYERQVPGAAEEFYGGPTQFDLTGFTSFTLRVSSYHYLFALAGPGFDVEIGSGNYRDSFHYDDHGGFFGHEDFRPIFAGGIPAPDDEVSLIYPILGDYGQFGLSGAPFAGGPDTNIVRVQRVAVPEPAAWALMLIGFGAAGAALRRRSLVQIEVCN